MNVLEVYPTFSWWLCGPTQDDITLTRAQLNQDAAAAEAERRAFYIVGDAAAFDLIPEAFDEIIIRYEPTALKRMVLERHTRVWLKPAGALRIEPDPVEYSSADTAAGWSRLSFHPAIAWQQH